MLGSILQVMRLIGPIIGPAIKEVRAARKERNSIMQQNARFEVRLEKRRTDYRGKDVTELVKESREDV